VSVDSADTTEDCEESAVRFRVWKVWEKFEMSLSTSKILMFCKRCDRFD